MARLEKEDAMRRSRRLVVCATACLLATAGTASAQDRKAEISAGWRHLFIAGPGGEESTNIPKGWYLDVAVPVSPLLSIVGDVGGHYDSETATQAVQGVTVTGTAKGSVHTFMGGVRLRGSRNPSVVPFGQMLFGGARASATAEGSVTVGGVPFSFDFSESDTQAALSVGGGVNLSAGSIGVRLQAEWLKVLVEDSGNAFRFGAGVVIPF
jgi:hypothetical protein